MALEARMLGGFISCLGIALVFTGLSGGGIWPEKAAACDKFLITVVLFIAAGLFLSALVLCLCGRHVGEALVFAYLLLLLLMSFAIFGLVVTKDGGGGHVIKGKGYAEFDLGDYQRWLRHRVRTKALWKGIKSCLMKRGECQKLSHQAPDPKTGIVQFNGLQSGCCKPLDVCGFKAINVSSSIYDISAPPSSSAAIAAEGDCSRFVNEEEKCFNCDFCRAAFLDTLSRSWRTMSIINFVIASLVVSCGQNDVQLS
ncbi:hypothetical protein CBR_g52444 [Chara braunii]|uniref:Tetraspanin n=1 Tax=Chara braunii TaxID=69332 RepID=A0A388MAL2_CHABU|nr:hypothetical protein CBR_g52444 [Chara braunii]|eukprot:GBG91489.1 hypothetical protein CBR_g52444 [Chara braunii]